MVLGANDTVNISGSAIIIEFNIALTGSSNKIRISASTVKDLSGNILATGVETDLFAAADIIVPTVSANPVGGMYDEAQNVSLTASETATIYYTTDGNDPTVSDNVYSGMFSDKRENAIISFKEFHKIRSDDKCLDLEEKRILKDEAIKPPS